MLQRTRTMVDEMHSIARCHAWLSRCGSTAHTSVDEAPVLLAACSSPAR